MSKKTTLKISAESQQLSLEKQKYISKNTDLNDQVRLLTSPPLHSCSLSHTVKLCQALAKNIITNCALLLFFYLFSNTENDLIEMW